MKYVVIVTSENGRKKYHCFNLINFVNRIAYLESIGYYMYFKCVDKENNITCAYLERKDLIWQIDSRD